MEAKNLDRLEIFVPLLSLNTLSRDIVKSYKKNSVLKSPAHTVIFLFFGVKVYSGMCKHGNFQELGYVNIQTIRQLDIESVF